MEVNNKRPRGLKLNLDVSSTSSGFFRADEHLEETEIFLEEKQKEIGRK